jgi:hypothetical protein
MASALVLALALLAGNSASAGDPMRLAQAQNKSNTYSRF